MAKPASHPLVGRWFHTFESADGQRRVQSQGYVIATADNGVLVQLHEWFTGSPSTQHWFAWPAVETWSFYPDAEAMNDAYETKHKPRDLPIAGIDYPAPTKPS